MKRVPALVASLMFSAPAFADSPVLEAQIDLCAVASDCVIVPYQHCCGRTKRAIHRQYRKLYEATPAWQRFNDAEPCAVMGICAPDGALTGVSCEGQPKRCQLQPSRAN